MGSQAVLRHGTAVLCIPATCGMPLVNLVEIVLETDVFVSVGCEMEMDGVASLGSVPETDGVGCVMEMDAAASLD